MFRKRLEILLTPWQVVVKRRATGRHRENAAPVASVSVGSPGNGAAWPEVLGALGMVLAQANLRGFRAEIALSDLWVHLELIGIGSASLREDELLLLARSHFSRQFPEFGQEALAIRLALQDTHLLAAGIPSGHVESLRRTAASAGANLSRIEPLFAWVHDRHWKPLLTVTGWMLLVEPGILTLALLDRGKLIGLHAQRCESDQERTAVQLLERQSALLAKPSVDVCVFSVGDRSLRLPSPWRTLWHRSIVEFDNRAAGAAAAA